MLDRVIDHATLIILAIAAISLCILVGNLLVIQHITKPERLRKAPDSTIYCGVRIQLLSAPFLFPFSRIISFPFPFCRIALFSEFFSVDVLFITVFQLRYSQIESISKGKLQHIARCVVVRHTSRTAAALTILHGQPDKIERLLIDRKQQ